MEPLVRLNGLEYLVTGWAGEVILNLSVLMKQCKEEYLGAYILELSNVAVHVVSNAVLAKDVAALRRSRLHGNVRTKSTDHAFIEVLFFQTLQRLVKVELMAKAAFAKWHSKSNLWWLFTSLSGRLNCFSFLLGLSDPKLALLVKGSIKRGLVKTGKAATKII
jgi:hypothetical protein